MQLAVERDPEDTIHVGAGGKLVVPREDISVDLDDASDLDLQALLAQKIRKPGRREWIALHRTSELTTRLLLHRPKPDGIEVEHYYVANELRGPIVDELKACRVLVYYSLSTRSNALWVINVTPENSWYEGLAALLNQTPAWFATNAIRVISDKANSRYKVRYQPLAADVHWPNKSTETLLGEALGSDRFITSASHPIFADLIAGKELV